MTFITRQHNQQNTKTFDWITLRKHQIPIMDLYEEEIITKVVKGVDPRFVAVELFPNAGKSDLITKYMIPRTIEVVSKTISFVTTPNKTWDDTFVNRIEGIDSLKNFYNKKTYWNIDKNGLQDFLKRPNYYLHHYDHIVLFGTLPMLIETQYECLNGILKCTNTSGHKWFWYIDEADTSYFYDPDLMLHETGTGGSGDKGLKWGTRKNEIFETYKETCGYVMGLSGTFHSVSKDKLEKRKGSMNFITEQMGYKKSPSGRIFAPLGSEPHLKDKNVWCHLVSEELRTNCKLLSIEYQKGIEEIIRYNKNDWERCINDSLKSIRKLNDSNKEHLKAIYKEIENNSNIDLESFKSFVDSTLKKSIFFTGDSREKKDKTLGSGIPFKKVVDYFSEQIDKSFNMISVHSEGSKVGAKHKNITPEKLANSESEALINVNLISRAFDSPYFNEAVILRTYPRPSSKNDDGAPKTTVHSQDTGRVIRYGDGFKSSPWEETYRKLREISIDLRDNSKLSKLIQNYMLNNSLAKVRILEDTNDEGNTGWHAEKRLEDNYIMHKEYVLEFCKNFNIDSFIQTKGFIQINVEHELCPKCGQPWPKENLEIDDNCNGIDKELGI